MEDLLLNFIEHIGNNVSRKLQIELQIYVDDLLGKNNQSNNINITFDNENYEEIEHGVKHIISNYFKNCDEENFFHISQNLYNGYIEYDDSNIIKAVKYFVRIYSIFEEIKLKKFFCRWRINILYKDADSKFNKDKNIFPLIEKNYHSNNTCLNMDNFGKVHQNKNNQVIRNKNDIFNKLYMDAFKKQDEKLLNNEL